MIWTRLSGVTTAVLAAALIGAPTPLADPAVAHADCGDPGQPACTGPVPTPDQADTLLARITDPGIPCQDKTDVVTPAFSPDECGTIDNHLNRLNAHGYIPFNFVVTDIQPAPGNFAGATVSVPHPWTPPGPIVLVDQGGHWLITHDTAWTLLDALWYNANRRMSGGGVGPGQPLFPTIP